MSGLLAEIESVVKVLISRMQRPTQSTSCRTQTNNLSARGQNLGSDTFPTDDATVSPER